MSDFYENLYNRLYEGGYKHQDKYPGKTFVNYVVDNFEFKTVLDAGCGIGKVVEVLQTRGKKVVGMDVSKVAVKKAKRKGRNCVVGSVCKIPFSTSSFDMVFCIDCLEHLKPCDVDIGIGELVRVSSKYLALKIALKKEKDLSRHAWFRRLGMAGTVLHLSVFPPQWWLDKIALLNVSILYKKVIKGKRGKDKHLVLVLEKK